MPPNHLYIYRDDDCYSYLVISIEIDEDTDHLYHYRDSYCSNIEMIQAINTNLSLL